MNDRRVHRRRIRLNLLLAGIRWRLASSLTMFAVALFSVGVGAFGPIYLHSANQSILDDALRGAPPGNAGLTLLATDRHGTPDQLRAAASRAPRAGGRPSWFAGAIGTADAGLVTVADGQPYAASLVSRDGACRHLVIVDGRCPNRPGTVILSTRSAKELGVRPGQDLLVTYAGSSVTGAFRVSGLYEPGDVSDPYWWGANPFSFGSGSPRMPVLDSVFASAHTVQTGAPSSLVSYMLQLPFIPGSLSVDDVGDFDSSVMQYESAALAQDRVSVSTQVLRIVSQATATEHTTATIVAVVDLQLVLLAVLVLYYVASRTALEREPDVRLAVLRGFRPRSALGVALAEPIAIVVVAVPLGLLAAWAVALLSASAVFGSSVGASITLLSLGAAAATGVAGVLAVSLASRRMVGAPDSRAPEAGEESARRSTWSAVADTAAIAVACAAFAELVVAGLPGPNGSSRSDPLAVFAPGVLALALGIVGARLLPPVLRATFRFTARSRGVGAALATRRVARRSEFATEIVLVTLAVALATFALSGWAIGGRNRTIRSEFEVGAAKVLTVSVRPGVNFLSAVRAADPGGRSAMAVVVESASDGTTLAVDSSRLGDVVSWPPGLGVGGKEQVSHELIPAHLAAPVAISGTDLALTVDTTVEPQPPPELSADLFDDGYQVSQQVALGSLAPGTATYSGSLEGLCPGGCTLVDLSLTWAPVAMPAAASGPVVLRVSSMSVRSRAGSWSPVPAGLSDPRRWTAVGGARLSSGGPGGLQDGFPEGLAGGLIVRADLDALGVPTKIAPADVPGLLPAVQTLQGAGPAPGGALGIVGLDGGTIPGRSIGAVPALPRIGPTGTLVDLQMAQRFMSGPFVDDTTEVWLSGGAPSSIVSRLRARGISVVDVDTPASREAASAHGGVELAYTLFLVSAVCSSLLAIGTTAFTLVVVSRRREGELAALRAVGIASNSLRRSLEAEQALVLGAGTILGVLSGVVAGAVAFKSVPEFVTLTPGPPLEVGLPASLLAVGVFALILLFVLTVGFGSSLVVRSASVEKLGGAQM